MDRLPSVGNGYVAPREAGPGRRSHMQVERTEQPGRG